MRSLTETQFIRKDGVHLGCSRICPLLPQLNWLRDREIGDREGVNVPEKPRSLCPGSSRETDPVSLIPDPSTAPADI